MKKTVVLLTLAFLLGFQALASAIQLEGEENTVSPVYKATRSAVKKTMTAMGIDYTIDSDGDIKYNMGDAGWIVYVIFNDTSTGDLWNLQVVAQFATKPSRYDELVAYANTWNAEKKYPKVTMVDRDSLRLVLNYPIQYGFNPDEFEDNVIGMFGRTIKIIASETDDMRM